MEATVADGDLLEQPFETIVHACRTVQSFIQRA